MGWFQVENAVSIRCTASRASMHDLLTWEMITHVLEREIIKIGGKVGNVAKLCVQTAKDYSQEMVCQVFLGTILIFISHQPSNFSL